MSIRSLTAALALAGSALLPANAWAQAPDVVVSIRPLHSLVSGVMAGIGEPRLLVDSAQSPHTYSLRPSDASALSQADAVFWIGPGYETFLVDALPELAADARRFAASQADGVRFLPNREGGDFEAHDHAHGAGHADVAGDEHAHEEAGHREAAGDEHAHEAGGDHGHVEGAASAANEAAHEHEEARHEGVGHEHGEGEAHHDSSEDDPHVWLSPDNAVAILRAVANELGALDPANAETYRANADREAGRIEAAEAEARDLLGSVSQAGFVVTHDGFQYFEDAFGPRAVASVTINPDVTPSAGRVVEIQEKIAETGTTCLVSEPQFPQTLMTLFVTDGSRVAALDYIGVDHEPGPDLYTDLMLENARKLADCLGTG